MIVQINPYTTMAVSRLCIPFLVAIATVLISVSGTIFNLKYVCLGDTVQLFQNLQFDPCNGSISIIVTGRTNKVIATWSYQHCIQNQNVSIEYTDHLLLGENGTITIHNITYFDQGKYVVSDQLSPIQQVNIQIPVAPIKDCIPIIQRVGNKLVASLKQNCGRPVATPYWKGDDGISDIHDQVQTIAEGTESALYTACIEGPALQCENTLLQRNHCSTFVINRSTNGTESAAPSIVDGLVVPVYGIILNFVIVFLIIVIQTVVILKQRSGFVATTKKLQPQDGEQHLLMNINSLNWMDIKELLNPDQQRDLERYCSTSNIGMDQQLVIRYLDSLNWMDIKELLNPDQQRDLERYCSTSTIGMDQQLVNRYLGTSIIYMLQLPVQRYIYSQNWMDVIVLLTLVQQMVLERFFCKFIQPKISKEPLIETCLVAAS